MSDTGESGGPVVLVSVVIVVALVALYVWLQVDKSNRNRQLQQDRALYNQFLDDCARDNGIIKLGATIAVCTLPDGTRTEHQIVR